MSIRTILVVALALMSGGSAAVGISKLRPVGPAPFRAETVEVVVAAVDLPRGQTLTPDLVKTREWPRDGLPPGTLTSLTEAVERTVASPLVKGEPVIESRLASRGAGRGLAALIPTGMRAYTIHTPTLAAGVAGFILPGNKVDVLLNLGPQGSNDPTGGGSTTTLLQKVEILAVDQRIDAPSDNKVDSKELRSVTLVVTPNQAAKLDLAQNKGVLHLALRNPQDEQAADTRPATLASLRFHQEKPWDERAKGLMDTLGKLMAKVPPEPAPKAAPVPKADPAPPAPPKAPTAPPPPLTIRTLHGSHEARVEVMPSPGRTAGRR